MDKFLRKYGELTTIDFDLYDPTDGQGEEAATFAIGDVTVVKDGGVAANSTNLPAQENGAHYSIALTATELQAGRVVIKIEDQDATKVWLDKYIVIETYGNASGQHAFDLDTATVTVGTNNDKTGYSISGTLTTLDALNTQLATDHGAGSWITATGFSTHSAADVWAVATRTLTAFGFTVDVNMGQTTPLTPTADTLGEALRFAHERLDAAVTTRSSHAAADVWSVATRTLTAFGFTVDINMGQALPATPTADTTGAALKDADTNLDATVSSRLAGASYTAPDNAGIAAILDDTGTSGVVVAAASKTGYSLAATGADLVLVDGKTLPAALQIIGAGVLGKASGAGTGTEVFVGLDGVTTRATVVVDANGNRTSVTYS